MEERTGNHKLKQAGIFLLKVHDRIIDGFVHIASWMTFAVTLGITYEIVSRYFFGRPTEWAEDFTDYTLIYMTFLAAAYLGREGGHVNLTYLLEHFHGRRLHVTQAVNNYICALVCAFIIWYSAVDTLDSIINGVTVNRALAIPKYYVIGVIPVGVFFLFVQFIRNGFRSLAMPEDASEEGHQKEAL
jgi:TRAP-type C4-dicarboxylate transport system permease small subunit